ncbi:hypothetical protein GHK56_08390 [Sinorhizobium meliloti]|nr:hypothetical protein [Sinorhizobium meliloti]
MGSGFSYREGLTFSQDIKEQKILDAGLSSWLSKKVPKGEVGGATGCTSLSFSSEHDRAFSHQNWRLYGLNACLRQTGYRRLTGRNMAV